MKKLLLVGGVKDRGNGKLLVLRIFQLVEPDKTFYAIFNGFGNFWCIPKRLPENPPFLVFEGKCLLNDPSKSFGNCVLVF